MAGIIHYYTWKRNYYYEFKDKKVDTLGVFTVTEFSFNDTSGKGFIVSAGNFDLPQGVDSKSNPINDFERILLVLIAGVLLIGFVMGFVLIVENFFPINVIMIILAIVLIGIFFVIRWIFEKMEYYFVIYKPKRKGWDLVHVGLPGNPDNSSVGVAK
jgi:hypothetical protein